MARIDQRAFIRDTAVATVILAGLYGLTYGVQFQPLQIPGYLLLVGFGTLGGAFGPEAIFPVVFGLYLIFLGMIGAFVIHTLRRQLPEGHLSSWRTGIASALGIVGVLSVSFAIIALFGTSQLDAVFITGVVGIILLGLSSWFAKLFTINMRSV